METVKRMSNVRAQAVAEASARRVLALVIRLKGREYASADKPLKESVLYGINQQLVDPNVFTRCLHDSMVIGLQRKYTTWKERYNT